MSLFSKVKAAFSTDNIAVNDNVSKDEVSNQDTVTNESNHFTNVDLKEKARTAFNQIENDCFPSETEAIFDDVSNQDVNQLKFGIIGPQGLTESIILNEIELKKLEGIEGSTQEDKLKNYIQLKLAGQVFKHIGNLQLIEQNDPKFRVDNNLVSDSKLRYFHRNEDLLIVAAQNMYFSYIFDDYPRNKTDHVKTFTKVDTNIIKDIYFRIQKYCGFEIHDQRLYENMGAKGEVVDELTFQLKNSKNRFHLMIFPVSFMIDVKDSMRADFYYQHILKVAFDQFSKLDAKTAKEKFADLKNAADDEITKDIQELRGIFYNLPKSLSELNS